jgi:hypothetical protein
MKHPRPFVSTTPDLDNPDSHSTLSLPLAGCPMLTPCLVPPLPRDPAHGLCRWAKVAETRPSSRLIRQKLTRKSQADEEAVSRQCPSLTVEQILAWADAHYERTGRWPNSRSGPIPEAPGQTWNAVNVALYLGYRGLPAGDSLGRLLDRHQRGAGGSRLWSQSWTAEEEELLRTLPPGEAARRTGRTLHAVYARRYLLGISSPRPRG